MLLQVILFYFELRIKASVGLIFLNKGKHVYMMFVGLYCSCLVILLHFVLLNIVQSRMFPTFQSMLFCLVYAATSEL